MLCCRVNRQTWRKTRQQLAHRLRVDQVFLREYARGQRIGRVAGQCLKRVDLSRRLRLLGVRVGALVKTGTAATPTSRYIAPEETTHEQAELFFPDD